MRITLCLVVLFAALFTVEQAHAGFGDGDPGGSEVFSASVPYGGDVWHDAAQAAARSKAETSALLAAMRALARQPALEFLGSNEGDATFSPPSLEGLAHKLCFLAQPECGSSMGIVTCSVQAGWPDSVDLQRDILASLAETPLLDRYMALERRREKLLAAYDRLAAELGKGASPDNKAAFKGELAELVAELDALSVYSSLLQGYDGKWKDPSGVVKKLEAALLVCPDASLLLSGYAEALIQLESPVKAHEHISRAIELAPDIAFFHDIEGTALLQQNLPSLAAAAYGQAISLASSRAVYRAHRGYALFLLGDEEGMCKDFQEACVGGDCSGFAWSAEQGYCNKPHAVDAPEKNDGAGSRNGMGKEKDMPANYPPVSLVPWSGAREGNAKAPGMREFAQFSVRQERRGFGHEFRQQPGERPVPHSRSIGEPSFSWWRGFSCLREARECL